MYPIKLKKHRCILSDILPYETPVIFSNRGFYDFLTNNEIEIVGRELHYREVQGIENILKIIFSIHDVNRWNNISGGRIPNFIGNKNCNHLMSIPFSYKIAHKADDFRTLDIAHCKNQLAVSEFYTKYRDLILYFCNRSPFSIRYPHKVAKCYYFKDSTHYKKLSFLEDIEKFEQNDREYESLKTYFVYKSYNNIHKFYESYKYHRCEKKYNFLYKFDVSKCFSSIYSHSISWAILGKKFSKEILGKDRETFGAAFDKLLMDLNYNETNGIVIGPEFSRIFAEIILQSIDLMVLNCIDKHGFRHKRDYEIFRYVDDYFLFCNDEQTKEVIVKEFRLALQEYKLYLNDEKSIKYEKPLITEITIAKEQIVAFLSKYIKYKITEISSEDEEGESFNEKQGNIYISSNSLITKFKIIIRQSNVAYKDILNFTFSVLYKKIIKILTDYASISNVKNKEKLLVKALLEILDFVFFLFSVSPRVNTAIKVSKILTVLIKLLRKGGFVNRDYKDLLYKKIYDNICFLLDKYKTSNHFVVESLYFLILLKELGKEYWLDKDALVDYLRLKVKENESIVIERDMNYFEIIVALFYMENKARYAGLKQSLEDYILQKYTNISKREFELSSEYCMLTLDLMTCPYIDNSFKEKLLNFYGFETVELDAISTFQDRWFVKWKGFNFEHELETKLGQEVY